MKLPNNGVSHVDSWGIINWQGRLLNAYPFTSRKQARECRKSWGKGAAGIHVVQIRTITVIKAAK
jgi:hypothetical protein